MGIWSLLEDHESHGLLLSKREGSMTVIMVMTVSSHFPCTCSPSPFLRTREERTVTTVIPRSVRMGYESRLRRKLNLFG